VYKVKGRITSRMPMPDFPKTTFCAVSASAVTGSLAAHVGPLNLGQVRRSDGDEGAAGGRGESPRRELGWTRPA